MAVIEYVGGYPSYNGQCYGEYYGGYIGECVGGFVGVTGFVCRIGEEV